MIELAASGGVFLWGFPSFSSVGGWEMLGWVALHCWRRASPRGGSPNSPKGVNIVNFFFNKWHDSSLWQGNTKHSDLDPMILNVIVTLCDRRWQCQETKGHTDHESCDQRSKCTIITKLLWTLTGTEGHKHLGDRRSQWYSKVSFLLLRRDVAAPCKDVMPQLYTYFRQKVNSVTPSEPILALPF